MEIKKINLHTHTTFCDGKNSPEEMVKSAIEKGFSVLGFSGHCIHPLNPDFYRDFDTVWHTPSQNIKSYTEEIRRLSKKYENQIKIYLGFEADYFDSPVYGTAIPDKSLYSDFAPDYLIGAVHYVNTDKGFFSVDNKPEIVEEDLKKFYSKSDGQIDGRTATCDYFETEREMLKKGSFEIIAHPDLIKLRNGILNFFNPEESWYKEEIKLTAKAIKKAGVIAEINTGAIARGLIDELYPSLYFLEVLHDYKVPVCINSDAHTTQMLDAAFERAAQTARKAGYTELVYRFCGKEEICPL